MKRRPAKKANKGLLGAIGAVLLGVAAGAAAVFLSKEENRQKVRRTVERGVTKGRVELSKAKRQVRQLERKGKKAVKSAKRSLR